MTKISLKKRTVFVNRKQYFSIFPWILSTRLSAGLFGLFYSFFRRTYSCDFRLIILYAMNSNEILPFLHSLSVNVWAKSIMNFRKTWKQNKKKFITSSFKCQTLAFLWHYLIYCLYKKKSYQKTIAIHSNINLKKKQLQKVFIHSARASKCVYLLPT